MKPNDHMGYIYLRKPKKGARIIRTAQFAGFAVDMDVLGRAVGIEVFSPVEVHIDGKKVWEEKTEKSIDEMYDFIRGCMVDYIKKAKDKRVARNKLIPEYVRAYRVKHGMTKEALAGVIGVERMQLYRWERGKSIPCDKVMKSLEEMKIVDRVET